MNDTKEGFSIEVLNDKGEVLALHKTFKTLESALSASVICQFYHKEPTQIEISKITCDINDKYIYELMEAEE